MADLRGLCAVLAAGVLAGALSAGCGAVRTKRGLTRAQFASAADAVCRHEQAKLRSIAERSRLLGRNPEAPAVIRQQVAQSKLATGRIEGLAEPPGDTGPIKRWLSARTVAATVALDLAEAPSRGDAVAVADVRRELAVRRARARTLAAAYGSQVCGATD
jgi:hypothetical protein